MWQFTDLKKPEHVLKQFIRFASCLGSNHIRNGTYAGTVFHCAGNRDNCNEWLQYGRKRDRTATEIVDKIESVGMLESIPLWIVTLLGSLLITVLSFVMILTVYGRNVQIYMYTAIARFRFPHVREETHAVIGKNFIRSYIGVCLEGAIIALACIIFSAYAASPPAVGDTELSAVTIVWNYVGELVFNYWCWLEQLRHLTVLSEK